MSGDSKVLANSDELNKEIDDSCCLSNFCSWIGCFIIILLFSLLINGSKSLWNHVITPGFVSTFRKCSYEVDEIVTVEISETENRGNLTQLTKTPWMCDEEIRIELHNAIHIPNDIQHGNIKIKIATVKGPYTYTGKVIGIKLRNNAQSEPP